VHDWLLGDLASSSDDDDDNDDGGGEGDAKSKTPDHALLSDHKQVLGSSGAASGKPGIREAKGHEAYASGSAATSTHAQLEQPMGGPQHGARPTHPSFSVSLSNGLTRTLVKAIQDFRKFSLFIPETLFHGKLSLALDRALVKADIESHVTARQWRARFVVHDHPDGGDAGSSRVRDALAESLPSFKTESKGPGGGRANMQSSESRKKLNLANMFKAKMHTQPATHRHRHFDRFLYLTEANPCKLDGRYACVLRFVCERIRVYVCKCMLWVRINACVCICT
jgi:hypothetical protein